MRRHVTRAATSCGGQGWLRTGVKARRNAFWFQSAFYATGNLVAAVNRVVGGILIARIVEPGTLGLFNGFLLAQEYAPLLQLGVPSGFAREYPLCVGAGALRRGQRLAGAAQAWAVLLASASLLAFVGLAGIEFFREEKTRSAGWLAVGIGIAGMFYGTGYLQNTYRTSSEFSRLGLNQMIGSVVGLCGVLLVAWLSFYGLCLRYVITSAATVLLLWIWRPVRVRPCWCWSSFKELLRVGLPIFGNGTVVKIWGAANGTLVLAVLGTRWMGLYAVANMVKTGLSILPEAFAQVIYPRITEAFGKGQEPRLILMRAVLVSGVAFIVCLGTAAITWATLPYVVGAFLPKYVDGIRAAQWASMLAAAAAFKPMLTVFNVIGRQRLALVSSSVGIVAYGAMLIPMAFGEATLVAFVQALLVGQIVQAITAFCLLYHHVGAPNRANGGVVGQG